MIEGSSTWSTMILNILTQNIYQDQPNAFKDRYKSHTRARTHTQRNATCESTKKQVQSRNDQNSSLN